MGKIDDSSRLNMTLSDMPICSFGSASTVNRVKSKFDVHTFVATCRILKGVHALQE